ncbi:hypothetical protein B0H15DRAFT_819846 [Mycena belliarum]|uniref:Uncharacterized protein n=1 Tax=Mycena belliarum TaxID=1033014 RepID=A0AAD6UD61_9AGAR|nr:hypothetical protein B0H15DRAFT_819846 [Mycena belliae]
MILPRLSWRAIAPFLMLSLSLLLLSFTAVPLHFPGRRPPPRPSMSSSPEYLFKPLLPILPSDLLSMKHIPLQTSLLPTYIPLAVKHFPKTSIQDG